MARVTDKRIEQKPSFAEKMFPNLQPKPKAPIDGWAKQRQAWGETDHRARGFVSALGGTVKRGK
jgi:hypothetical protein